MKRIEELRKQKNLNQTGLAMQLNVSQKMISAYERGTNQPSINTLKKLSEILDVSVDYLIENSDIKIPAERCIGSGLSDDEIKLLDMFKQLDKKRQQMALGIIFALNNLEK